MPTFRFPITSDATRTAVVEVEAATIQEAHQIALGGDFYQDPSKAQFELDDCNGTKDVYLPDADDYEELVSGRPHTAAPRSAAVATAEIGVDSPFMLSLLQQLGADRAALGLAYLKGPSGETFARATLVRQALTDGSVVYDVVLSEDPARTPLAR